MDPLKELLTRYLASARDGVRFKLVGLSERELRMPMTSTGTNLLGVTKHLAAVEAGYFGACLGKEYPEPMPWFEDAEPNTDMFATAEESAADIIGLYDRVTAFADAQIAELPLDAPARVPWWRTPDTTLQHLIIHMIAETSRHAGQLDVVRESLDGAVGLSPSNSNLPEQDAAWWAEYVSRLRTIAEEAPDSPPVQQ